MAGIKLKVPGRETSARLKKAVRDANRGPGGLPRPTPPACHGGAINARSTLASMHTNTIPKPRATGKNFTFIYCDTLQVRGCQLSKVLRDSHELVRKNAHESVIIFPFRKPDNSGTYRYKAWVIL
jgi:hypothetical protein